MAEGSAFHSCAVVLSPRLSPRTQAQPRCRGRHRRVRVACVVAAVPSEHSGLRRAHLNVIVAVVHADNGAGPSVDVPCGLCTGREARQRGRCTGMLRQSQRQQRRQRRQRRQRQRWRRWRRNGAPKSTQRLRLALGCEERSPERMRCGVPRESWRQPPA